MGESRAPGDTAYLSLQLAREIEPMVGATDGTGSSREPPMYGGLGLRLDGDPRDAAQSGTLLVQTRLVLFPDSQRVGLLQCPGCGDCPDGETTQIRQVLGRGRGEEPSLAEGQAVERSRQVVPPMLRRICIPCHVGWGSGTPRALRGRANPLCLVFPDE